MLRADGTLTNSHCPAGMRCGGAEAPSGFLDECFKSALFSSYLWPLVIVRNGPRARPATFYGFILQQGGRSVEKT